MGKDIRCNCCAGAGKTMGAGMMYADCDACDGRGKIKNDENDFDKFNLESTESYSNAIKTIQEKCNVDKKTAKELFDNEIKNEKKRGKN